MTDAPFPVSDEPPARWLDEPELAAVLAADGHGYLAVEARSGPHVTPHAVVALAGRLWLATPHDSLKAKVVRKRDGVGLLVESDAGTVVVRGSAAVLDAADPTGLVRNAAHTLLSGPAMAAYAVKNGGEVVGMVRDALGARLGADLLTRRVLVAVEPATVVLADADGVRRWGRSRPTDVDEPLDGGDETALADLGLPDLDDVPDGPAALPAAAGPVVLGWATADGPVALPAHWDPGTATAAVDAALWQAVDALPEGAACLTFDESVDVGASGKRGLIVRGTGEAVRDGGRVLVALGAQRVTWWQGSAAETVDV